MHKEPVGIRFQETLSGGFALGETDPDVGQHEGKMRGSALTMKSVITIGDLEQFTADPHHAAKLNATIDFTPFDKGIESADGVFNLFKPSDDPTVKLMVYRFGFAFDDTHYFFEGKKFIHEGSSIPDLWAETTTLPAKLYEGLDDSGPILGSGILTIDVQEVIDLVASTHVTHTLSPIRKAEAIAKFGKFFLGELWDAYRSHLNLPDIR